MWAWWISTAKHAYLVFGPSLTPFLGHCICHAGRLWAILGPLLPTFPHVHAALTSPRLNCFCKTTPAAARRPPGGTVRGVKGRKMGGGSAGDGGSECRGWGWGSRDGLTARLMASCPRQKQMHISKIFAHTCPAFLIGHGDVYAATWQKQQ